MSAETDAGAASRSAAEAALDDAAIAVSQRIIASPDLEPADVAQLGYAAWCLAAGADNRQPHRAKRNPHDAEG